MRAGQRVIFHHISKSAGTSMVNLLRRNYPHGGLLEVYDRQGRPAPDATPQGFAAYLAQLDPELWEQVRCLTGHSINFAIPVLSDPFQVFTIVRDPVDRVVSLYHYLKGRDGFGERGGRAGELIRENDWSIVDIYRRFGGAYLTDTGEHHLFAAFFNGQTRTILAPHFTANQIPMADGQPDVPAALETLDWVLSEHYLLGSASRYGASVERFAAEFDWSDTTVMRENVTPDRPALEELPREVVETIRRYNTIDDELHERALAQLVDIPDPQPSSHDNGPRRLLVDRSREVKALTIKLHAREHALARAEHTLERTERAHARTEQALARTEQTRRDLEARLERHERELGDKVMRHERGLARLRAELARVQGALEEERTEHNHLRGTSTARDQRLRKLTAELAEREQTLTSQLAEREETLGLARQTNRELETRVRRYESDLASLRGDHARIEGTLNDERTELNRLRGASAARDRRRQVLVEELAGHLAKREQALAQARQFNQELEAKARHQESELARLGEDLDRVESALALERTEHNRLAGASGVRDVRLQALTEQLAEREQRLAQTGQAVVELQAQAQRREQELADLRGLVTRLLHAGRRVAGDLGWATSEASTENPEPGVDLLEATLERVQLALTTATRERRELSDQLEERAAQVLEAADRERDLAASVRDLEAKLADARATANGSAGAVEALMHERQTMARHARSLAASRAWRYGHSTSMLLRRMAFRPSKKKRGAADVLFDMLEAPPQLPAPSSNDSEPSSSEPG